MTFMVLANNNTFGRFSEFNTPSKLHHFSAPFYNIPNSN